ncbi:tRNA (guanosine(46)-N7)-methyltransferase TrmB [Galactobacter valiniphilus]|uniref:tRNA (guanine-N(7)-)-methyltransferase n=1 Tax=Galactobacter valiniphilus TaxID=2676122 RepID=A0A399JFN8_9MICC|nr:tRNA (guanosine(46)-N7)-methyltransferase TrmB [Galactobacter valiniphilus]RII43820.1 tRNA (guanosine(46)-N7)-methyltransferase TrmB [Galactobacter valiniphilus]
MTSSPADPSAEAGAPAVADASGTQGAADAAAQPTAVEPSSRTPRRQPTPGKAAEDPSFYRAEPVSFVRRGERMTAGQERAWEEMKDELLIDVPRHHASTSILPDAVIDIPGAFEHPERPLTVEIGSGLGEATAHAATEHPERNFLAVEVYTPGLAKLMEEVRDRGLKNVRVMQANAPEVLDIALKPGQVDELWIFFSDPWHKKRHHKRRLITDAFAERAATVIRPGGTWRLATDWSNYAEQMRRIIADSGEFVNVHDGERSGLDSPLTDIRRQEIENREAEPDFVDEEGGWAPRFAGRTLTSFEAKALKAGRNIFDLTARRV